MPSPELLARLEELRPLLAAPASIEQRRMASVAATAVPPGARIAPDVVAGVAVERLRAGRSEPVGLLLYLHAGAYVAGAPSIARGFLADLAPRALVEVVSPAYRLAPEHPFPAAVEDALAVYRHLVTVTDPTTVVVGGTSAGGGLAVALLVAARDEGLPMPAAAFALCPWVDLTLTSPSMVAAISDDPIPPDEVRAAAAHYLAGTDARSPLASPVFADLTGLPPLHLEVGTADRLADDGRHLAERAAGAGVEVTLSETEGGVHSFPHLAPGTPEADAATGRIADHVRGSLPGARSR